MILEGKVVMVTGALGALGTAVTAAIRDEGGTVVATDITAGRGVDIVHDVTKEIDWRRVCDLIERRHVRLDGLVNNAGIVQVGSIETASFDDYRRLMAVNIDGVFLGCKLCWPLLCKSSAASIVNVSSTAGIVGSADYAAYNASKGAVRLLSKSVALHGARRDPVVRCNSLHPSLMPGNMAQTIVGGSKNHDQAIAAVVSSRNPMRRLADPAEIADAVVFLLSSKSTFVTGSELIADGGSTAM